MGMLASFLKAQILLKKSSARPQRVNFAAHRFRNAPAEQETPA
jgi:hypothetical protein